MKYEEYINKYYKLVRNALVLALTLATIYPCYIAHLFLAAIASAFSVSSFKDYINSL